MNITGVYLVTDRASLSVKSLYDVVLLAVKGGAAMVQLREKDVSTRFFIEEARRIKKILAPYAVPLIINDRVDVALAVGADGVHIGQEDMPYPLARKLLGSGAIIGLSVETPEQVVAAEDFDVAYLGVSAIFATPTKPTPGIIGDSTDCGKSEPCSVTPWLRSGGSMHRMLLRSCRQEQTALQSFPRFVPLLIRKKLRNASGGSFSAQETR